MKKDVSSLLIKYFPTPGLWDEDVSGVEGKYPFHYNLTDLEREQLQLTVQAYLDLLAKFIDEKYVLYITNGILHVCPILILPLAPPT